MGADIKKLRSRIKSVESTRQITKAMELVASSKLRRAKQQEEAVKPYYSMLLDTIRDIVRIGNAEKEMHVVNMGGSAIGTCINVDPKYLEKIPTELTKAAGYELVLANDLIDATQNLDGFDSVSSALKTEFLKNRERRVGS